MWRVLHSEWCDREVNVSRVCLHQMDLERLSWRPRFNLHLRATWDTFIRDWDKATEAMGAVGGVIQVWILRCCIAKLRTKKRYSKIKRSNTRESFNWLHMNSSNNKQGKNFRLGKTVEYVAAQSKNESKRWEELPEARPEKESLLQPCGHHYSSSTSSSGWQHWQRKNALDNLHIRFLRAKNRPQKGCWPSWPECRTPSQSEGLEAKKSLVLQPSECDPRRMFRSSLP